jgi:hypothetical protein
VQQKASPLGSMSHTWPLHPEFSCLNAMVSDFAQETNPLRKPWLASGLREKNMS